MSANGVREQPAGRRGLKELARQLWGVLHRSLLGGRPLPPPAVEATPAPVPPSPLDPLRRLRLSDGVGHTLFEEFAAHRRDERGDEEIGWVLLGLREKDEAVALATLPAGAKRDAGVAHVEFNSTAQAVASLIARQNDRRLNLIGVVHTHPGSLRHPSEGDFEGDSVWVRERRGGEAVFGIGTADVRPHSARGAEYSRQPRPNAQVLGELCFSWYSLRAGEKRYRDLPVELTLGPDLARPLHDVWPVLERHAERLERLYRQQAGLWCEVVAGEKGSELAVNVPLAEKGHAISVRLSETSARYFVLQGEAIFQVGPPAEAIDKGVYLLLAELAARG